MTQEQELIDAGIAQTRRLYHHVLNGGTLTDNDMSHVVQRMEGMQAEISSLRAQLDKAREVKPLEWVENSSREYWYTASGMGVQYEVKEIGLGKWWLSIDGEMLTFPFDYAHNAKSRAQADYQRRYNAMSQEGE